MKSACFSRWTWLVIANVVFAGVLGFYSTLGAAPQSGQPPYANQIEQQAEQIRELQEIKELLKEQNAMLRGGAVKAVHGVNPVGSPSLH